jgi:ribosomal protein L21E
MNPDMDMQEILEHLEQQMIWYRRGLLTLEQALDQVGQSAKTLSVKVIEYDRGQKREALAEGTTVVIHDIPGCGWSGEVGVIVKVRQDGYTVEFTNGRHWAIFTDDQVLEIPF